VLLPIAKRSADELFLATGEASDSHIAEITARAAADGRPLVILYFADFDPSGNQMAISVSRKVQAHIDLRFPHLKAELHQVALTFEQVTEYELPSTPLTKKEKRSDKWKAAHGGREQTEIDALAALRPDTLRQLTQEAIAPFYDPTLDQRAVDVWSSFDAKASAWFAAQPAFVHAKADIDQAYAAIKLAGKALAEAQQRALDALTLATEETDDAPKPPTDVIEPDITAIAPKPLFTTDDNWVAATRRLIARKVLEADKKAAEGKDDDEDDDEDDDDEGDDDDGEDEGEDDFSC
jgi:hypothetical protein